MRDIQDILDNFSYMPGWRFKLKHTVEGPRLDISFTVVDADDINSFQEQCVKSYIPPFEHAYQFLDWLRWRLNRIAIHEVSEFFRFNGEKIFDPHAESYG